jgi:hypothetical protein
MNTNIRTWVAALALLSASVACTKEDTPSYSSQNTASPDQRSVLMLKSLFDGKWIVKEFRISRTVQSGDFREYVFSFYKNGTVQAVKGWSNVGGLWMNAANDNPNEFVLNFFDTPVFLQLDAEWHINVLDDRSFEMQYVSREGLYKFIRFEKL